MSGQENLRQENYKHEESERIESKCGSLSSKGFDDESSVSGKSESADAESLNPNASEVRSEQDIDALIALLDGRTGAGDSRIKVDVVEGEGRIIARQYHHGRCDVGSPWACGASFDVLE